MASTVTIDLRHVARGLNIPLRQIQAVVELLDDGNTVPFITRYRKDHTGGLDEEQIRQVQGRLTKMRLLSDRKQTILRSIEAQGKLTEQLAKQIHAAGTTKRLEDLYLPFKPRKQTLATLARSRGLEPLAREILEASPACADLDARAQEFVNTDRKIPTAADALLGAGHILAEQFSEDAELRQRLREIFQRTGKYVSTQAAGEQKAPAEGTKKTAEPATGQVSGETAEQVTAAHATSPSPNIGAAEAAETTAAEEATAVPQSGQPVAGTTREPAPAAQAPVPPGDLGSASAVGANVPFAAEDALLAAANAVPAAVDAPPAPAGASPPLEAAPVERAEAVADLAGETAPPAEPNPAGETAAVQDMVQPPAPPAADAASANRDEGRGARGEVPCSPTAVAASLAEPAAKPLPKLSKAKAKLERVTRKELKKQRIDEKRTKAFRDYFSYSEEIKKIPPHRILAINRGERAKVLRVKVEADMTAMYAVLDEMLVPPGHPHADYLRGCARDALQRLILPSLEREIRRELTDRAETHAVGVFAKNLRNLLLQPPVRDRRVLAVDPGYKSGCKLAALDQFGNVLDHGVIFLVGKPERRKQSQQKVIELINRYQLSAVTIGNGTACRESEDFFAELLDGELKGRGIAYVIVNEAGASVYSTSRTGREEFPHYDASLRGAISIGRRLQDPLSELVKIDPANIGVGLYQHDVKAKHLEASLDEVVESCVNYVGVDVNTASPALLRYVSGLNQLTARRVYEYRCEHGPFRSREQLHNVPGFGEATLVQAAGFLKIAGGSNPLDATWIHPESYEVAEKVLAKVGGAASDLLDKTAAAALGQRVAEADREALAKELNVGTLTLSDILAQLARPGRDPREDLPAPIFKQGVLKLEDLTPGMELTGTVLNVVDFGCFIDIGMHDSGLVHVSQLADKFVRDPHEIVAVGDIVKVWVLEVDKQRRRVSLTMIRPGSERPRHPRHGEKAEGEAAVAAGPARPPRPATPRPPHSARPGQPTQQGRQGQPAQQGQQSRQGQQGRGQQGRPPRPGGPPQRRDVPPRPKYQPPKPRPKPLIPITEAMKQGKEPMRTFGDLLQFYGQKQVAASDHQAPVTPAAEVTAPAAQDRPREASPSPEPVVSERAAPEQVVTEQGVSEQAVPEQGAPETDHEMPARAAPLDPQAARPEGGEDA